MKKIMVSVLAGLMAFSLCACGETEESSSTASKAETTTEATTVAETEPPLPDVEVNLTASTPMPKLNIDVPGEKIENEDLRLNFFVPNGVETTTEGGGANTWTAFHFKPADESWKLKVRIDKGEVDDPEWTNLENHPEQTSDNKLLIENAKYNEFDAKLFADEGKNWKYDNGIYLLLVSFGDVKVKQYTHLAIEATGSEGFSKPEEFLAIPELAAMLTGIEVVTGVEEVGLTTNGLAVTYPDNFDSKDRASGVGFSGRTTLEDRSYIRIDVYLAKTFNKTPEESAQNKTIESFERTYGDINWYCGIKEGTNSTDVVLFTEYNDKYHTRVDLSLNKKTVDEAKEYMDSDEFKGIMESIVLDPDSFSE